MTLAAELVNDPPATPTELVERCREAGLVVQTEADHDDLEAVETFLARWQEVVDAVDHDQRAAELNDLLAAHAGHPRLVCHDDQGWHLHHRPEGVSVAQMLTTLVSVGTALHLTTRGMDRLGRCSSPPCRRVYADTSRNGRQRYCSSRCASRQAVRRHRGRASARHTG